MHFSDGREKLISSVENYIPFNEQEEKDRTTLLTLLKEKEDLFRRENAVCHMSASAWTVNRDLSRVLMAYHNIYRSFSWLGGHADGDTDLLSVALREVCEESGIQNVHPLHPDIFSLEILTVDGHEKRGRFVASHLHLNVTYLVCADETETLHIKPDENSAVRWFTPAEALDACTEEWMRERIYSKLIRKTDMLKNKL